MTTYVVFVSFEIEADSEDEAMDEVTNQLGMADHTEVWVQGQLDADGALVP